MKILFNIKFISSCESINNLEILVIIFMKKMFSNIIIFLIKKKNVCQSITETQ